MAVNNSHRPALVAWAGVWSDVGETPGFAGLLVPAGEVISAVSRSRPLLLRTSDHQAWLDGAWPLQLSEPRPESDWFVECLSEI